MSARLNQVLAAPLVIAVKLYQRFISPLSGPSCRFYPSCSAYAVTALTRFGPVRGGWLAIRRLGRCNPWNPGGVDPVPMTWATRNDVRPEDFRPTDSDTAEDDHTHDDEHDEHAQHGVPHREPTT
jgi:putative membrane protein insertion efficiency factor